MQLITYDKHAGINQNGNAKNIDPMWLWDIQNGYIDKDNNIQQRSGLAAYWAGFPSGINSSFTGITYLTEVFWNSGTSDLFLYAKDKLWYRYLSTTPTGTTTGTTASKLVDSGASFAVATHLWRKVTNTTDATTAYVTAVDSATTLSLSSDIFTSGENYRFEVGFIPITASVGGTGYGQAVMFNNVLHLVDGGTPRTVSSVYVVANLGGSPPSDATAIHVHNGHVVLNSTALPSNVYVSALNNSADWSTANDYLLLTLNYVTPIADEVLGFASFSEDCLVIVGKRYVLAYNAPPDTLDWSKQDMIESGGLSNYANLSYGAELFIAGRDGLNTFRTLTATREVADDDMSSNIDPVYKSYVNNMTSTYPLVGCIDQKLGLLYLSFNGTAGSLARTLVFSLKTRQAVGIFKYEGDAAADPSSPTAMCRLRDGTILIAGNFPDVSHGYSLPAVYTMNSGTRDYGIAFRFYVKTPFLDMGDKEHYKTIRKLEVAEDYTETHILQIDYTWDTQGGMPTLSPSMAVNANGRDICKSENLLGRGHSVQLTFTNSSGAVITIPYWTLGVVVEGTK